MCIYTKASKLKRKNIYFIFNSNQRYVQYFSGKYIINLNCKVGGAFKQQDTRIGIIKANSLNRIAEDSDYGTIKCRHLAYAYAECVGISNADELSVHPLDYAESECISYDDVAKCVGAFTYKLSVHPYFQKDRHAVRTFSHLVSKKGYFFHKDDFPKVIKKILIKHWGIPDYEERFILSSGSHAMAVSIKNKSNGKYSKIIFYDPNDTLRHYNTLIYNPYIDIDKLTLESISAKKNISYHFKQCCGHGVLSSIDLTTEDKCKIHIESSITKYLCYLMAREGHFKKANLGEYLNSEYKHKPYLLFELYGGENNMMLHLAMSYCRKQNVGYITKYILNSPITTEQKIILLANDNGLINGFNINFDEGVEAFCKEILTNNNLSAEDKYRILTQQNSFYENGLYVAFKQNNPDVIKTFTKIILQSDLSKIYKKNILTIVANNENTEAINFELKAPESFTAFIDTVTEFASNDLKDEIFHINKISSNEPSNLYQTIIYGSMKDIEQHLSKKFNDTALSPEEKLSRAINTIVDSSLEEKNYSYINNFVQALLANDQLTEAQKEKIFMYNRTNRIFITNFISKYSNLSNGDILRIFKDILNNKSFSGDNKVKRLLNISEESAINTLLILDETKLIEQIATNLLNRYLSEKNIIQQLQPNSNRGSNWLYDALNDNRDLTQFINRFTGLVLSSNISEEAKVIILTPINQYSELVSFHSLKDNPNQIAFKNTIESNNFSEFFKNYPDNGKALNMAINYASEFGYRRYLLKLIKTVRREDTSIETRKATFSTIFSAILTSQLLDKIQVELLQNNKNCTSLLDDLLKQDTEVVKKHIQEIMSSRCLSIDNIVMLLQFNNSEDTINWLRNALDKRDGASYVRINQYIDAIASKSLNKIKSISDMFHYEDRHKKLQQAFIDNNINEISNITSEIIGADIQANTKVKLLHIPNIENYPEENIIHFFTILFAGNDFQDIHIVQIIDQATDSNGIPLLSRLIKNGKLKVIKFLTNNIIRYPKLGSKAKNKRLQVIK